MPRPGPCRSSTTIVTPIIVALALLPACRGSSDDDPGSAEVLAQIDGHRITRAEVETRVQGRLVELDIERYEVLKEGLDEIIDQVLLEQEAKTRDQNVDELLEAEVSKAVEPPDAAEVDEFYEKNKAQLGGQTIDRLRPSIEIYLRQARVHDRRAEFLDELRGKSDLAVMLRPPTIAVEAEGPTRGNAEAAVTIVEFSDFRCPYCKRVAAALAQVLDTYGDRVRLVYRHYPLQPDSERTAEAASCANEQGKFWAYHDLLFTQDGPLDDGELTKLAAAVGADTKAFEACLESGRGAAVVARDAAAGEAAGVSGTPAFFINGRPLVGAIPYDALRKAIDDALQEGQA